MTRRVLLAALCISLLALPAAAKEPPELHSAKVISQNLGVEDNGIAVVPVGTMMAGVPIRRQSNIVVIETTKRYRLTISEVGRKFIILPVNGTVQYTLEDNGRWLVIRDQAGKKHKFGLLHAEALPGE